MNEKDILQLNSSTADILQPAMNENIPPNAAAQIPTGNAMGAVQTPQTPTINTGNIDAIKQAVVRDIQILENLMNAGIINPVQGQHLMKYVVGKAYQTIVSQQGSAGMSAASAQPVSGLADFERENPGFFKQNGRAKVLEYLNNSNAAFDKDELVQISKIVELLENSAIESYLQKQAHEKSLNDENEAAKQKLRANAQNSNKNEANTRIFTREQIGRMSGAEFAKNERMIMDQLRKGLIH